MTDFINAVSVVGFPIVSFFVCAWFIYYSYNKSLAMYDKSLEKLGTLADAINHNTEVLLRFTKDNEDNENND